MAAEQPLLEQQGVAQEANQRFIAQIGAATALGLGGEARSQVGDEKVAQPQPDQAL